ncbi:MAG: DUF1800 domain-containing protein [Hyphomicrobiales bacterium]|nr:DUF1800 domain-containing protein [Hyphomicrobiales bacterium]
MSVADSTIAAIRFGYGFRPGEAPPTAAEALIKQLQQGARARLEFDIDPLPARVAKLKAFRQAKRTDSNSAEFLKLRKELARYSRKEVMRRLLQRAQSPHGFYERLAAFWADHFSVSSRNLTHRVVVPMFEIEAIRPNIMGDFAEMLVASCQHPVMLYYLDQPQSFGPNSPVGQRRKRGLNENLAREFLELHTLGVGGPYTQRDVREFAELLTGYAVRQDYAEFRFLAQRAEPGAETVLGRSYGGGQSSADDAAAFLRDLARHPATSRYIAQKLAVHFIADEPPEDLVAHLEQAFQHSDGHLPRVYEALVEHPAAWDLFGRKVKPPVELMVSTWRALGLDLRDADKNDELAKEALSGLRAMGQRIFDAPGPDGWPETAVDWITPQGLAARIEWVSKVAQFVARQRDIDPRRFAEQALGDALSPQTMLAVAGAPERWEGIALTLASPEFNRR